MASTTSEPFVTSPKIVCLPVSHVVGATVMKNCEPSVPGPANCSRAMVQTVTSVPVS